MVFFVLIPIFSCTFVLLLYLFEWIDHSVSNVFVSIFSLYWIWPSRGGITCASDCTLQKNLLAAAGGFHSLARTVGKRWGLSTWLIGACAYKHGCRSLRDVRVNILSHRVSLSLLHGRHIVRRGSKYLLFNYIIYN